MKFKKLDMNIYRWAKDRGIFDESTIVDQHRKIVEEVNELGEFNNYYDKFEAIEERRLEIGDVAIALIILAHMCGYDFLECIDESYEKIKNRTGKIENGLFVKDKEECSHVE